MSRSEGGLMEDPIKDIEFAGSIDDLKIIPTKICKFVIMLTYVNAS